MGYVGSLIMGYVFIGCILLVLISEFFPPPKRSQNTKIRKPKRSYKSSDYTIDSTSFHVVDSGDCDVSFHDDIKKMIQSEKPLDIEKLAKDTEGFSGADLKALCTDAAMGPIRSLGPRALSIDIKDVPPISFKHFKRSLRGTRPSVAPGDLVQYEEWDKIYGSKRANEEEDDDSDDE